MKNTFQYFLFILFISINCIVFAQENPLKYYKLAVKYENEGNIYKAIDNYKLYYELSKDQTQKEQILLKLARLTPDYKDAVIRYKEFLDNNPLSRFRFLARFELATLYKINKDFDLSLIEFYKLSDISKGTPYWQKSILNASQIEFENNNYKKIIKNLYDVLQEIDDYEDIGNTYFLLGITMEKQKIYEDAAEFFLICAGSFPQCSKASGAFLELLKIYLIQDKKYFAVKTSLIIDQLYTDSPEKNEARKLIKNLNYDKNEKLPEIELINLNENQEIKKKSIARLLEDLKLTTEIIKDQNDTKEIDSGFYIQFGYYSSLEYAKQLVDNCNSKNIKDVFIAKITSPTSGNIFYRILLGPFSSSQKANTKLIEIKEKNIEAMVLELSKNYE